MITTILQIVTISSRLTSLTTNINLKNYSSEFTPTEYSAGGTLFYIDGHKFYKPFLDINIYEANQIESIFVEIIKPKQSDTVIDCRFEHPNIEVLDFENNNFGQIFEITSKERKQVFLIGDFDINILNYNDYQTKNVFLDSLASHSFIKYFYSII